MVIIIGIKRNTILSTILACVLLFPLINEIPLAITIKQSTLMPNDAYAQISSTNVNSSSITTPLNASTNIIDKMNATQIANQDINTKTGPDLSSNDTLYIKNQFMNENSFLSNVTNGTNANITSISSAAVQGSPRVTGDFTLSRNEFD